MAELVECSDDFRVERAHLAVSVGSGDVEVLSTPSLLAFVESVASRCLSGAVSPGYTTVGTYVELRHKAPAPQGATVRVTVRVENFDGKRARLSFRAECCGRLVGDGVHERVVVNKDDFLRRAGVR